MKPQIAYQQLNDQDPALAHSLARMLSQGFSASNASRTLSKRAGGPVARLIPQAAEHLQAEAAQAVQAEDLQ